MDSDETLNISSSTPSKHAPKLIIDSGHVKKFSKSGISNSKAKVTPFEFFSRIKKGIFDHDLHGYSNLKKLLNVESVNSKGLDPNYDYERSRAAIPTSTQDDDSMMRPKTSGVGNFVFRKKKPNPNSIQIIQPVDLIQLPTSPINISKQREMLKYISPLTLNGHKARMIPNLSPNRSQKNIKAFNFSPERSEDPCKRIVISKKAKHHQSTESLPKLDSSHELRTSSNVRGQTKSIQAFRKLAKEWVGDINPIPMTQKYVRVKTYLLDAPFFESKITKNQLESSIHFPRSNKRGYLIDNKNNF